MIPENAANQTNTKTPYLWRIKKAKERVLSIKPSMDLENAVILTKSFQKTEGDPLVLQKAKAFREQCEQKTVTIWQDELIVGCSGSKIRGGILCADVCWSILNEELDTISTRPYDPFYISEDEKNMFNEVIKPYWKNKSGFEKWIKRIPPGVAALRDTSVIYIDRKAVRGPGELNPDYPWILEVGITGIQDRIRQNMESIDLSTEDGYEKKLYLEALLISSNGIITLAGRYAEEARRLAEKEQDPRRKKELEQIAEICQRVPAYPARTFREAMQGIYLYHICIFMEQNAASYNPGRLDQYLYPFYQQDIAAGRITQEQAQELFDCLWIKYAEPCLFQDGKTAEYASGYNMFQNACCGGIDQSGQDAVNNLSYMMLQAMMDVQLYQPSLSVRYNSGKNPAAFLSKVVDLVALGTGFPAIHNDECGIKMMLKKGVSLEEAYDWNPCGCVESNLAGKLRGYTAIADVNLGSAVEFALTDGIYRLNGDQLVPPSGNPKEFTSFSQVKAAVKQHLKFIIKKVVEANHVLETIWDERPVPAISLGFQGCVDNATDYAWGGAKYSAGNGIIMDGVADLINSLAAIDHLIFRERSMSWTDLLNAINHDFEGLDAIRQLCLSAPKYGNDRPEVDAIGTEMFHFLAAEVDQYETKYGRMTSGILPVTAHVPLGLVVGALPSGRKAGTTLTDGMGPTGGTDVSGPTAVLKSVSKIPHDMFVSGTLLNLKLDPELLKDERGKRNLMSYIKSMCDLGIYHVQFNVIANETLLAAQKEPEHHKDLLVRVAGYTAYFVELGKDVQEEIIGRTMQSLGADSSSFMTRN